MESQGCCWKNILGSRQEDSYRGMSLGCLGAIASVLSSQLTCGFFIIFSSYPKAEVSSNAIKVSVLHTTFILGIHLRNNFLSVVIFFPGQLQISLSELFSSVLENKNVF